MTSWTRSAGRRPGMALLIPAAIGFAFLLGAVVEGGYEAGFVWRASRATATFAGAVARTGGNHGGTFLYPSFRFLTGTGESVTFTSRSGSTAQPYRDGDAVTILYDPELPAHAELEGFWRMWAPAMVPAALGLGFLLPVGLVWRAAGRR